MARTPRFAAQLFCSDTLSAPPAKPMGARPLSGGAQRSSALRRRRTACAKHRSGRARHAHVQAWRLHAVVEALQALRGGPCTGAVTMVAARGALTRFDHPRALLQCRGLIPAAYAAGARRQQGSLTQAGNPQARRALVAGAWASRSPAQVSRHWPLRLAKPPKILQDSSWQAHVRLCKRSRPLVARGPHAHLVTVAMARELAGCRGAMAKPLPVAAYASKDRLRLAPQPRRGPTGLRRGAAPVWCHPRQRSEARRGYASRDRGRPPTDARKVGPNPRRAAGSTVVFDWLRLCRCTEVKKHHADLKNPLSTLDIASHSNAGYEPRPEAEA
jgi:Transposase IS116/IS110/IS902 family